MDNFSAHRLFQYLEKNNPSQLSELLKLRMQDSEIFEKEIRILYKELTLKGESFLGCNLLEDKSFLNELSEHDEEQYFFGGNFKKLFGWNGIKKLTRNVYHKNEKLIFFSGDRYCLKGKLVNEIYRFKQELKVVSSYEKQQDGVPINKLVFFDERFDKRGWNEKSNIKCLFWMYQFNANNRQYLILSKEKLNLEYGIAEGNLIPIDDFTPIGYTSRLKIRLPIILLNKWHSFSERLNSKEKFLEITNQLNITKEKYFNFLFAHPDGFSYIHPNHFQELISAFLLSAKINYPSHLLIISKPGSGKSYLEEAVHSKFDEDIDIIEGSCSTIKALIPSFKGNLPAPGALLSSNRICVIDEFLRILMRVPSDERNEQLAALNPILEHKRRRVASGNGEILMNPSCRALMVSNPVWGTNSMDMLCERIDNSFLSRILIKYQDTKHIKFIQKGEGKQKTIFTMDKEVWLGIVDFMHSFVSKFDKEKVDKIFDNGLKLFGDDTESSTIQQVREVYTARYQYHILKLMDGIIKTRCLHSRDNSFEATDRDYNLLENLWLRMILDWNIILERFVKDEIIGKITQKGWGEL